VIKLKLKILLFCIIIFSNDSFAKEFEQLFKVYTPINNTSEIEKAINNSFDIMIYRLSGIQSPSNIWKIINAGNTRKDFIKSYSLRNIDGNTYLEVVFNKDNLINIFKKLSIPAIGNSRPVILFMISIDSGTKNPYLLSNYITNSDLESKINDFLNQKSKTRGIYLELPEFDLLDLNEIKNYEKLNNAKELVSSQYSYDFLSEINIMKIGSNKWSVTGDIKFEHEDESFEAYFMDKLESFINTKVDDLLAKKMIDTSSTSNLNAIFKNIDSYEDYKSLKEIIRSLVGIKSTNLIRFDEESIYYDIEIYGDFLIFIDEISDNTYINVNSFNFAKSEVVMSFK
jgi:hypothetical protein